MRDSKTVTILLVEDEPLIQITAVEHLESLGFDIETAASASEAMSKLKLAGDVEAAIIDIGLPDRKGDILITEMRAIYPSMAIIVASGYGESALHQRFKSDNRMAFLGKPYGSEELRSALASLNVVAQ